MFNIGIGQGLGEEVSRLLVLFDFGGAEPVVIPEIIIPPQPILAGVGGGWAGPSIPIIKTRKKRTQPLYSYQAELERQISIEDEEILVCISQFLFLEAA